MPKNFLWMLLLLFVATDLQSQISTSSKLWHGIERTLRYHPEGRDIVISNGNRRFTRALYGSNTGFRVEAGDLPEFGLYMPGMGGNIKFGIIIGEQSKWLIHASNIKTRYSSGSMRYEVSDHAFGTGKLYIDIVPFDNLDGVIIKVNSNNIPSNLKLVCVYGGANGKKFSRDGDMGPDPESSFYLKPENCTDNSYNITGSSFLLRYGTGLMSESDPYVNKNFSDTLKPVKIGKEQKIAGSFPSGTIFKIVDANNQVDPLSMYRSTKSSTPALMAELKTANNNDQFFAIYSSATEAKIVNETLANEFNKAKKTFDAIANRVIINTPDSFINALGGVLAIAADAVWETPTYLHGAIGWRMRLNGWRGPYVGDVLGWHKRSKMHFRAYAKSQLTSPEYGPVVMDTVLHLARSLEKLGTSVYSSGYICRNPNGDFRAHHYDMNLVFIDALFRHFYWTGDISFAKEMWPVIKRHFVWEKRNFDSDDDGLYDAYAAIWASDALQYSGGSVTHSSSYNFKANKDAAIIARLIGEDPTAFEREAEKIHKALNKRLWLEEKGCFAEFQDLLGNKLIHDNPAVWTLYHAIDSEVPDPFQAYQCIDYIDRHIPHIPVVAKGISGDYHTISTSKWMPYDWSLNNVATAEVMHTALAAWQAEQPEKAFNLFKAELLSTMYLGGSAGNIGQISFYDAARGEAYRDFADPVAMTARSLVEGLFGITPNALNNELLIKPGFPKHWNKAAIELPYLNISFQRNNEEELYEVKPSFKKKMKLILHARIDAGEIQNVTVNGKLVPVSMIESAIGTPVIRIDAGFQSHYTIRIRKKGKLPKVGLEKSIYFVGDTIRIHLDGALIKTVKDPQNITDKFLNNGTAVALIKGLRSGTIFVQLTKDKLNWWMPFWIEVKKPIDITASEDQPTNSLRLQVTNHTQQAVDGLLVINNGFKRMEHPIKLPPQTVYTQINVPTEYLVPGSNIVSFETTSSSVSSNIVNWNIEQQFNKMVTVNISPYFNDKLTNIFKNEYLSPRPETPTLQLPTHGIGDWTHPLKTAEIDDSGFRSAIVNEQFKIPQGISFRANADSTLKNILFVSNWSNYPSSFTLPLNGTACRMYLLMAGSTNPMQSRLENGRAVVFYADNSSDTLSLRNPENWWPIEQDYLDDGFAFTTDAAKPIRVHLKTGRIVSTRDNGLSEFNGKKIDGGAATILDIPLNRNKILRNLKIEAVANDVIIGLMAVTLVKNEWQ